MEVLTETINPTSIEREPIHLYNRIQPHGVLLVLSEPELKVSQTSSNSRSLLGISPGEIIGKTLHPTPCPHEKLFAANLFIFGNLC